MNCCVAERIPIMKWKYLLTDLNFLQRKFQCVQVAKTKFRLFKWKFSIVLTYSQRLKELVKQIYRSIPLRKFCSKWLFSQGPIIKNPNPIHQSQFYLIFIAVFTFSSFIFVGFFFSVKEWRWRWRWGWGSMQNGIWRARYVRLKKLYFIPG